MPGMPSSYSELVFAQFFSSGAPVFSRESIHLYKRLLKVFDAERTGPLEKKKGVGYYIRLSIFPRCFISFRRVKI